MHLSAPIHIHESDPRAPHTLLAITLWPNPPHGVEAWVGTLRLDAGDVSADEISSNHYVEKHSIHVCRWADLWEYLLSTPHANLVCRLHEQMGLAF